MNLSIMQAQQMKIMTSPPPIAPNSLLISGPLPIHSGGRKKRQNTKRQKNTKRQNTKRQNTKRQKNTKSRKTRLKNKHLNVVQMK
jgi:hypothetical protein